MSPQNYSTNFKGDRILLEFDEYVKFNDLTNQLLVSPPLDKQPEFIIRGRQVIINLNETLRDSTTYTFNLGEGIVDNNEGNVLDSNVVVFSTGPLLDSLECKGLIRGAYESRPMPASIILYDSFEDSVIVNKKPTYFTKSNEQGEFTFSNLKAGSYKLCAIKDDNKNYKWEITESLAFCDSLIEVSPNDSNIYQLQVFKELPKKQFVREYTASKSGKAEIKLNMPVDSLTIESIGFEFEKSLQFSNDRNDSIVYWFKGIIPKSSCFLRLSDGEWVDTIAVFNFEVPEIPSELPKLVSSKEIQIKDEPLTLSFNRPIQKFDTSLVLVSNRVDSLAIPLKQINPLSLQGEFNWKEGTAHQVIMYPGFISDIYQLTNDTIRELRNVKMANFFSQLNLSVKIPTEGNYILNLESDDGKVERTISSDSDINIEWKEIPAGKYILRLINDENNNGIWDTGDYFEGIQPEKVYVMYDLQKLRSNWVLDQVWEISD